MAAAGAGAHQHPARILEADHRLMAALIAASTVLAPFTLSGWLWALS